MQMMNLTKSVKFIKSYVLLNQLISFELLFSFEYLLDHAKASPEGRVLITETQVFYQRTN